MRHNKSLWIFIIGFIATIDVEGQNYIKANRYSEAYKQYLDASCPLEKDDIQHFAYFSRDRESIHDHPFLNIARISGAQIMYSWRQLEPKKGQYDFSAIQEDYDYLASHGKKLFVQLQDVSFSASYKAVPDYLMTDEYDGGCIPLIEEEGWVAKRWNPNIRSRWALLLRALGKEFDGKIEGVNFQETAAASTETNDPSFSPERYVESIKENMKALKLAFPNSVTMQYANFMPGEWLPWDDKGYLRAIYQYGNEIGVGLGGPDLMVQRKGQLNHLIAMMHENEYSVPLGVAVQDGNYTGKTGADKDYSEQEHNRSDQNENIVPLLHAFANEFLGVSYIFWVNQEPYFSGSVIPCINN